MSELPIPSKKSQAIQPRHSARGGVVLLPPRSTWEAIDVLREKHDAEIVRWMPHIRLLHPFKEPESFEYVLNDLRGVCQRFAPFELTLAGVRPVELSSGRGALWLTCEPAEPVVKLQAALAKLYPELPIPGPRDQQKYVPYVSVGKTRTHNQAHRIAAELDEQWEPVSCPVDSVILVGRDYTSPMQQVQQIPLG